MEHGTYVHDGNRLCAWVSQILDHVLDQHAALGDLTGCDNVSAAGGGGYVSWYLLQVLSTWSLERSLTCCCSASSAMAADVM